MAIQEILSGVGVLWSATKTKLNAMFVELYAQNTTNESQITTVDVVASGYISGKKSGVFAFLSAAADTTVVTAATLYPIAGTFNNAILENFGAATANIPGIKSLGVPTQHFEVDWHATISADNASATVTLATKKNGVLSPGSEMSTLCKTAGDKYTISGTCVCELSTDDEIQLVLTSDSDGDVVTVHQYTTTINEFFD